MAEESPSARAETLWRLASFINNNFLALKRRVAKVDDMRLALEHAGKQLGKFRST